MNAKNEISRIAENLAYIAANRFNLAVHFPKGWIAEVEAEAVAAGILPPHKTVVGIACRPGIDNGITYGGDMEEVF